ncbi:phosphate regulon sensor histidine kinase PhoR [Pasteurellaceae bacterium 22721_9_1]
MKFNYPIIKNVILQLVLTGSISFLFSLFSKTFSFWFIISLLLLIIWHNYNEAILLQLLNPNKPKPKKQKRTAIEYISQTAAYYQESNRRDKIKTLRLLSKLNRNIKYLPDAVIICKNNGDISWCNQSAQQLFEFFWEKKVNKSIFNVIFYPEFRPYFQQENTQRPLVLLDHNKRYIELHLNRYDNASLLIIARNVTSFVRLLHSRQTFLANINHELRTPLTVLQGYLEMLESDPHNNELYEQSISAMKAQSQRMANLIQQLGILSKIENSNNTEHCAVNVSDIIISLKKHSSILQQAHRIHYEIEPDIYVMGDENQIQSAISNLIYNALRHSGDNAFIEVSWKRCEQGAQFIIKDNGVGIEAKHLAHLTERFYRVDESRSNETGGSGLGLAIVKHALEQHNSQLQILSEVNKGSEFSFILKEEKQLT